MRKAVILSVLCILAVCMAGCRENDIDNRKRTDASKDKTLPIYEENDKEIEKESDLAELKDVYKSEVVCEEWVSPDIESPGGVLCGETGVIVTDREKNCIVKTDDSGNVIKKAGGTGSGEGKFLNPGAVAGYKDEIFVIDEGNQRIQVFDWELNYVREIRLKSKKEVDLDFRPGYLAVSREGVYVSGNSLRKTVIDRYGEGEPEEVGDNFIGSVVSYKDKIYAINSMVRYYSEEYDSFGAATNGPAWLLEVNKEKLCKFVKLPHGFNIKGFVMEESRIVCISGSAEAVFVLSPDGEYKETFAYIQGLVDEEFPQISGSGRGEYYIVLPDAGKIFQCRMS